MSQPTYLNEKSEGDHSMSVKQETGEAFTPRDVLPDSHTTVKATCLKSSSQGCFVRPLVRTLENNVTRCPTPERSGYTCPTRTGQLPLGEHGQHDDRQENEQTTYRVLLQEKMTEHEMTYRPRGPWSRSAHSSPRAGKPLTGRRGTGCTDSRGRRGARAA
jgi:hypothetical protein